MNTNIFYFSINKTFVLQNDHWLYIIVYSSLHDLTVHYVCVCVCDQSYSNSDHGTFSKKASTMPVAIPVEQQIIDDTDNFTQTQHNMGLSFSPVTASPYNICPFQPHKFIFRIHYYVFMWRICGLRKIKPKSYFILQDVQKQPKKPAATPVATIGSWGSLCCRSTITSYWGVWKTYMICWCDV